MARNKYRFSSQDETKTFDFNRRILASMYTNGMTNPRLIHYIRTGAELIEEQTRRTSRQFELKREATGHFSKKEEKSNLSFSNFYADEIHSEVSTILEKDIEHMKQSQLRFYAGRIHQLLNQDYYTREGISEQDLRFRRYIAEYGDFNIESVEMSNNISRLLQSLYKNEKSGYHKIKYETQLKEIFTRFEDEGFSFLLEGELTDEDIQVIADYISGKEPSPVAKEQFKKQFEDKLDNNEDEEDLDGSIIDLVGNRSKKY